jgi:hypothetical protein
MKVLITCCRARSTDVHRGLGRRGSIAASPLASSPSPAGSGVTVTVAVPQLMPASWLVCVAKSRKFGAPVEFGPNVSG